MCSNGSVRYRKKVEKERVFKFLTGLNEELDSVKGRILNQQPLPLSEKFSLKCAEKTTDEGSLMIATFSMRLECLGVKQVTLQSKLKKFTRVGRVNRQEEVSKVSEKTDISISHKT